MFGEVPGLGSTFGEVPGLGSIYVDEGLGSAPVFFTLGSLTKRLREVP